jgi:hypothetical protein
MIGHYEPLRARAEASDARIRLHDAVSSPTPPITEPLRFDAADVPVEQRVTAGSGQEFDPLTAAASHNRAFPKSIIQWPEHLSDRTHSAAGWTVRLRAQAV